MYVQGEGFSFELPERVQQDSFNDTDYIVDAEHSSSLNPDLLDNWEQLAEIKLPRSNGASVTVPWEDGFTGMVSGTLGRDIKKENGWNMLFHTFKSDEQTELVDYMCFYNANSQLIKVFYFYEMRYFTEDREKLGPKWFVLYGNGDSYQLEDSSKHDRLLIFPNLFEYASSLSFVGWNVFLFHIPKMINKEYWER